MGELIVRRNGIAWSTWNVAKYLVGQALDRAALPHGDERWRESYEALRFAGTDAECEAVEVALVKLDLDVARVRATMHS